MKAIVLIFTFALVTIGCQKTRCTNCYILTDQPGLAESKTYCGTEQEIQKEDARLVNGCVDLKKQYPGVSFNCGCD